MDKTEILNQVQGIFRDILDEASIVLTDETTAKEVEGWDSLTHIQLVVAIEKHFKIKFASKDIFSWKNIADLITSIHNKVN